MNKRLARSPLLLNASLCALLVSPALGGAQAYTVEFDTAKGPWVIQVKSFKSQLKNPPKSDAYHCILKGTPVRATFNGTGAEGAQRVLTAPSMTADVHTAQRDGGTKEMVLDHAEFTGGVAGEEVRAGSSLNVSSQAATVTTQGTDYLMHLIDDVRVVRKDANSGSFLLTGSNANILSPLSGGSSGDLDGPVHFDMDSRPPGKSPSHFVGDCDHAHFDMTASPFTVTMTGNVRTSGDLTAGPFKLVSGTSAKVIVRFIKVAEGYQVVDVSGENGEADMGDH